MKPTILIVDDEAGVRGARCKNARLGRASERSERAAPHPTAQRTRGADPAGAERGSWGPRERRRKGVRGTKSPGEE
jgi:hypothetical protein